MEQEEAAANTGSGPGWRGLGAVLRAVPWAWGWAWWCVGLSVVVEAADAGLFPAIRFGAIGARAVLIGFALVAVWLPLDLAHACHGFYRRLRREAGGRAGVAAAVALVLFALFAAPFAWAMRWLLRVLEPHLATLRLEGVLPREAGAAATIGSQGLAALAVLGVALVLWNFARMTWHGHVRVVRARGRDYLAKGYALMTLMRLRQNRHDFFKQVPVVSNVRELVLAVIVHEWARGTLAAGVLPWMIVAFSILRSANDRGCVKTPFRP